MATNPPISKRSILFVPDAETAVDLLYFEPIAAALTDLINSSSDKPITIGVHGDWGAGKSSLMRMVEARLSTQTDVLVLHFDGWRFQGFDDAKTVLLETIVESLRDSKTFGSKIKDETSALLKRIKWLKLAKKAGELGVNYLAGLPTPGQIQTVITNLGALTANPTEVVTAEQIKAAIDSAGDYLEEVPPESVAQSIHSFTKDFQDLLAKTGLKKLVVLIDDLDRCLPTTTIETLEAIRLFLFVKNTAFVIAADEGMIEYAVRQHFPDLPASTTSTSYARNYLEKLIQTPFRLPSLGVEEAKVYVTLLLVQSITGEDHAGFKALVSSAREIIRQPWLTADLKLEDIQALDASRRDELTTVYQLALQIGRPIAEGTSGNPRQIKRFLNALAVREAIARARGLEEHVKRDALAKLMLAERFRPDFYNAISMEALRATTGTVADIASLEAECSNGSERKAPERKSKSLNGQVEGWLKDDWLKAWASINPPLGTLDLRPYAFVARDRRVQLGRGSGSEAVAEILAAVTGGGLALASAAESIRALSPGEAEIVFNSLRDKLLALSSLKSKPDEFEGLCRLLEYHPTFRQRFADLLGDLDISDVGPWIAAGWRPEAWELGAAKDRAREIVRSWATGQNKPLKAAAAPLLKKLEAA